MFGRAKEVQALRAELAQAQERLETEHRNYTDIVTQALVDAATDTLADAYIAALEIAAGTLSRAFAAATVGGAAMDLFTPWTMAQIGRQLVEYGDAPWFLAGRRLIRGDNYELNAAATEYSFSLAAGQFRAPASRVVHVRWNIDTNSGRGMGPLQTARSLRVLMQRLEASVSDELNAAVGYLLPIPADGDAGTVEALKADLAALKGRIAVIETARQGWGTGPTGAPRRDYDLMRMGPNIPASSVQLYTVARNAVLTACGMPIALTGEEDGTAQREAWRRYLHGTVAPLGRLVVEAAAAAGLTLTIAWDNLFASDIAGRARAFQSLVGGGMSLENAAAASGILTMED